MPSFSDLLARAESHELFVQALHGTHQPPVAFTAHQPGQASHRPSQGRGYHVLANQPYRGQHPRPSRGNGSSNNRNRRASHCQLCRTPGHYASQCSKLASFATSAIPTDEQLAHAFHAQCHVTHPFPDWTTDTGASDHMTDTQNNISNPSPAPGSTKQENSSSGLP
ncbi:uncharacterized protein LOC118488393 [Helianthus annuus]|uniref:uncharacterized protein LOC118488393 n=1 Tax=Helianthus annuus TaxID=4232 RepID=UPI0016532504|nr:uncharacterized protein LOC118488393 [Helianthus annuus]